MGFASRPAGSPPIDFLFNNAGKGHPASREDYKEADWDEVFTTKLKGPFFLAQAVGRAMISAKRPDSIINTSSEYEA